MGQVEINNKWIDADFVEVDNTTFNPATGKRKICITARIVPFGKVSRNGIMYNRQTIEKTYNQIPGLNLHHNHITDGERTLPRGEWIEAWIQDDGLYGKAEVYETTYNKDYIEWLTSAKNVKVSLQVNGDAQSRRGETGNRYQEAYIKGWKEISTVNIPGFIDAEAQFAVMAEKLQQENNFEEKISNLIDERL